jgi:hypothetical protein
VSPSPSATAPASRRGVVVADPLLALPATRRAVIRRAAYTAPAVVALQVGNPGWTLGRSGPTRPKNEAPQALPQAGSGPSESRPSGVEIGGLAVAVGLVATGLSLNRRQGTER